MELMAAIPAAAPAPAAAAPAAAPVAPVEPERKDAGARGALKLQVAFELSSGGLTASDPRILRTKFKPDDVRVPTRGDKQDFISAIREGTRVMTDAEIGHRTCSIGQIGHIAIRLGRALEWDPEAERFENDDDANAMLQGTYRGPWKL